MENEIDSLYKSKLSNLRTILFILNMVSSMFSSLSSLIRKPKRRKHSLALLPDDLLVEIASYTAASSLSTVCNLRLVSKSFGHICDDPYVLCRLSLQDVRLVPSHRKSERQLSNFLKRCGDNGNPQALYRLGLISYFLENRKDEGLELLDEAARKGNKEAKYVYGLILICLGDKTKQKGYEILSSLIKPLMSQTMEELVKLQYEIRNIDIKRIVLWNQKPAMKELKRSYVRDMCGCDGKTRKFLVQNCAWNQYGVDRDMDTSSACTACLWHYEIEEFLDRIE